MICCNSTFVISWHSINVSCVTRGYVERDLPVKLTRSLSVRHCREGSSGRYFDIFACRVAQSQLVYLRLTVFQSSNPLSCHIPM